MSGLSSEDRAVEALQDVLREYLSDPFGASVSNYTDGSGKVDLAALKAADQDADQRNDEFYRKAVHAVLAAAAIETEEEDGPIQKVGSGEVG